MGKANDSIDYKEDLNILKKSMETVRKLNWNKENKTSKNKRKDKVKNSIQKKVA